MVAYIQYRREGLMMKQARTWPTLRKNDQVVSEVGPSSRQACAWVSAQPGAWGNLTLGTPQETWRKWHTGFGGSWDSVQSRLASVSVRPWWRRQHWNQDQIHCAGGGGVLSSQNKLPKFRPKVGNHGARAGTASSAFLCNKGCVEGNRMCRVSSASVQLEFCTKNAGLYSIERYAPEWATHITLAYTRSAR